MESNPLPPKWTRILISCFIVLNLSTVAWVNFSEPLIDEESKWIDHHLNPIAAYRLRYSA